MQRVKVPEYLYDKILALKFSRKVKDIEEKSILDLVANSYACDRLVANHFYMEAIEILEKYEAVPAPTKARES